MGIRSPNACKYASFGDYGLPRPVGPRNDKTNIVYKQSREAHGLSARKEYQVYLVGVSLPKTTYRASLYS